MGIWGLIQILINVGFGLTLWLIWVKLSRPAKEDPRLSKGLQILQSKISVLEDLSDKTEIQVNQLSALLDRKCRELNHAVVNSEKQVQMIDQSIKKSMNVAKIFQDKIPHDEIIDRQRTQKYVQAARLAHQGQSFQEIAQSVDLPLAEISLIAKINKDETVYKDAELPDWVEKEPAVNRISDSAATTTAEVSGNSSQYGSVATAAGVSASKSEDREPTFEIDELEETEEITPLEKANNNEMFQLTSEVNDLEDIGKKFREAMEAIPEPAKPKSRVLVRPAVTPVKFPRIEKDKLGRP